MILRGGTKEEKEENMKLSLPPGIAFHSFCEEEGKTIINGLICKCKEQPLGPVHGQASLGLC